MKPNPKTLDPRDINQRERNEALGLEIGSAIVVIDRARELRECARVTDIDAIDGSVDAVRFNSTLRDPHNSNNTSRVSGLLVFPWGIFPRATTLDVFAWMQKAPGPVVVDDTPPPAAEALEDDRKL
jgi:hypothetical protein